MRVNQKKNTDIQYRFVGLLTRILHFLINFGGSALRGSRVELSNDLIFTVRFSQERWYFFFLYIFFYRSVHNEKHLWFIYEISIMLNIHKIEVVRNVRSRESLNKADENNWIIESVLFSFYYVDGLSIFPKHREDGITAGINVGRKNAVGRRGSFTENKWTVGMYRDSIRSSVFTPSNYLVDAGQTLQWAAINFPCIWKRPQKLIPRDRKAFCESSLCVL